MLREDGAYVVGELVGRVRCRLLRGLLEAILVVVERRRMEVGALGRVLTGVRSPLAV